MRRRVFSLLALGLAVGLLMAFLKVYLEGGIIPDDTLTYLAAGERLNAGHSLYSLSPGDRPVLLNPPYWTVPLVSPPPIAVIWRPLAALPNELGVWAWWVAQFAALMASLGMLGRRVPLATAIAIVVLLIPTVNAIGMGNVNSLLLLGLILSWRFAQDGHESQAGAIAALMTAVKLTPGVVGWWLIVTGRLPAVRALIVTAVAVLALSLLGAGIGGHVDYVRTLAASSSLGAFPGSLADLAISFGIPPTTAKLLPLICAVVGMISVFFLRRRPAASYSAAVVTVILGSPAVSITWYVLLYALLAPIAWPVRSTLGQRDSPIVDRATSAEPMRAEP